jgi:hypothetical protein
MNRKLVLQLLTLTTTLLLIFTLITLTVQSVPPIPQKTWIVDASGNGDFTSIQNAIDNSTGGDTIILRKGVYHENNININKMITISGQSTTDTIINCSGKQGFTLNTASVEISNLKITNSIEYGIYVPQGSAKCTISNILIDQTLSIGIYVRGHETKIINCDIRGASLTYGNGIMLFGSESLVKDCNIQGFSIAVIILLNSDNHRITNCNLFNNGEAVDIRIDSNNNIVSDCNIYVNQLGVYVWQNSNNNQFYLNNFFKNKVDASAEGVNTWDNGTHGNYWEAVTTEDADSNGIGDTPYTISEGNIDRFPLTTMLLFDELTTPTRVTHTTSRSDNTPSFTWEPSIYSEGIKGYYVKIDNNDEIFIGDTTTWTSQEQISDGVHTFYIRAEGNDNTSTEYATITFSIDTVFIDYDGDGWSDEEEQQYGTDPHDADNYPLDSDNDHVPDSLDLDDDNDGYSDNMETSYGTDPKSHISYPTDTDNDDIPDENSQDGKYKGDVDDDDDSLIDSIEINLGSNPIDGSDVEKIYLTGKPYYLIDISQDGIYDILYNPESDETTAVEKQKDNYLIDEDGDDTWDYIYNSIDGSVSPYKETILPFSPWILIILAIIITISIVIIYYTRIKPRRLKISRKSKKTIRPVSLTKPDVIDDDTLEMLSQTKTLLKHIQDDVKEHMDRLHQLEGQMGYKSDEEKALESEEKSIETEYAKKSKEEVDELLAEFKHEDKEIPIEETDEIEDIIEDEKLEEEKSIPEEKTDKSKEAESIEDKVDEFLAKLEKKDKKQKEKY